MVVSSADSSDQSLLFQGKKVQPFGDTGWKMMAAAGIALLLAGFAAGLFFPESLDRRLRSPTEEVVVTTTAGTVPARRLHRSPLSLLTAAPSASSSTSPIAAAVTTQIAVRGGPVRPTLVVTDEPVADVADRLVPSVVHLEITSQNILFLSRVAGSGVIFDSEADMILTAAHVVAPVLDRRGGVDRAAHQRRPLAW